MNGEIILSADRVRRKKKFIKIAKLVLLVLMLLLLVLYVVVGIIYNSGTFCIILDKNLYFEKSIIIYDDPDYKVFRTELYADTVDSFDNISYKWLPNDLDDHEGGSHNGDNYVAYTFYIENLGETVSDYWSEIIIDDVIKNVDEAVRIRVYKNGDYMTYAKLAANGKPEKETVPFESDTLVALDHVERFGPGDINKYTIVLWLEGTDSECTDNIIGGEIKIHMAFNSEIVEK
ncbi:MAG: hypothetical protein PHS45_04685 [Bacilli bacterium]|nr:hypothetical protein [Bacilli bacterium]